MKKILYVFLFTIFGVLLQFIVHGFLEIWYIGLLLKDFPRYGFGFSWDIWVAIHTWSAVALFFAGGLAGFWQGRYWWRRIYESNFLK